MLRNITWWIRLAVLYLIKLFCWYRSFLSIRLYPTQFSYFVFSFIWFRWAVTHLKGFMIDFIVSVLVIFFHISCIAEQRDFEVAPLNLVLHYRSMFVGPFVHRYYTVKDISPEFWASDPNSGSIQHYCLFGWKFISQVQKAWSTMILTRFFSFICFGCFCLLVRRHLIRIDLFPLFYSYWFMSAVITVSYNAKEVCCSNVAQTDVYWLLIASFG